MDEKDFSMEILEIQCCAGLKSFTFTQFLASIISKTKQTNTKNTIHTIALGD